MYPDYNHSYSTLKHDACYLGVRNETEHFVVDQAHLWHPFAHSTVGLTALKASHAADFASANRGRATPATPLPCPCGYYGLETYECVAG
jgi:hypothetical protein